MNKKSKMIFFIILVLSIIFLLSTSVFARNLATVANLGNIDTSGSDVNTPGLGKKVFGVVHTAGIIISVATLMIIAIKYMISPAEQKAEQKKRIPLYITGAVFVFAIAEIANLLNNTMKSL